MVFMNLMATDFSPLTYYFVCVIFIIIMRVSV